MQLRRTRQKTNSLCLGKAHQRATQATPPLPPVWRLDLALSHVVKRHKHEDLYSLSSPYCCVKISMCCKERKYGLYSEQSQKIGAKSGPQVSVDYTPFYRQHLCRGQCTQEQCRPQQHTWNSMLFVIFPAEFSAAQSLHFQHLMWTEVMSSRRL